MLDIGWTIWGIFAVIGFPVFRGMGLNGIETAQNWLRQDWRRSAASIVQDHSFETVAGDSNWRQRDLE
jgi:hypothetical protein